MSKKLVNITPPEPKQTTLNRLLVERALTGVDNPLIKKLQKDIDLLNFGIIY